MMAMMRMRKEKNGRRKNDNCLRLREFLSARAKNRTKILFHRVSLKVCEKATFYNFDSR